MMKTFYFFFFSLVACLLLPGLMASEVFKDARVQLIEGTVDDNSSEVTLVINPNSETAQTFQVPVSGDAFSKSVDLEPGLNKIHIESTSSVEERDLSVEVLPHSLRFELTWSNGSLDYNLHVNSLTHTDPPNGTLDRDTTNAQGHGIENVTFSPAPAGAYKIYVHYNNDNSQGTSSPTTLNVYLNEQLLQTFNHEITTNESLSDISLSTTGDSIWSVGTLFLHSDKNSGGYIVDNKRKQSFEEPTFSTQVDAITPTNINSLSPISATPIELIKGESLEFEVEGQINYTASTEETRQLLNQIELTGPGSIDEQNIYFASEGGSATITATGTAFTTDLKVFELASFEVDGQTLQNNETLFVLEDQGGETTIDITVNEKSGYTLPAGQLSWVNATSINDTTATFPIETPNEPIYGDRVVAYLGDHHYIDFNIVVLDPLQDSDSDGISDYEELFTYGTQRLIADTDGDGTNDGDEVAAGRDPNAKEFQVTFDLQGKATLQSGQLVQWVPVGTGATAPNINVNSGFLFTGWSRNFDNITENTIVYAQFTVAYTVTFLPGSNGSFSSGQSVQTIVQGGTAIAPTVQPNQGWFFTGWNQEFSNVQSDLTVTAQYHDGYDVTFTIIGDGSLSGELTQTIAPGASTTTVTATANPDSFFKIWSNGHGSPSIQIDNIQEDMQIVAYLDNQYADSDGDGISNSFEVFYGTNPTDFTDKPSPTIYVDPTVISGDGSQGSPLSTIQEAIDQSTDFDIIHLAPGIYIGNDNRDLNINNKRITILSEKGAHETIIDVENDNDEGFYIQNVSEEMHLSGVKIIRAGANPVEVRYSQNVTINNCIFEKNYMVNIFFNSSVKVNNCIFNNNMVNQSYETIASSQGGETTFNNCLFIHNKNNSQSADLIRRLSSSLIAFNNCIIWNNTIDDVSDETTIRNSIVELNLTTESALLVNNLDLNPEINPYLVLPFSSPAVANGSHQYSPRNDFWGKQRHGTADIGPFDMEDSDSDNLPDNWELFYYNNLNQNDGSDTDGDNLTASDEYIFNASPKATDTDGDYIPDDLEVAAQWSPRDDQHLYRDYDGDGFTTSYEIHHGSDPTNSNSTPDRQNFIFVDPNATINGDGSESSPFTQLRSAINAAVALGDYSIVLIKPGVLKNQDNSTFNFTLKKLMIIGEEGPLNTIIDCELNRYFNCRVDRSDDFVLHGVTFRNSYHIDLFSIRDSRATISNCIFERNFGEIVIENSIDVSFFNCIFRFNKLNNALGLIYFNGSYGSINNCSFINNEIRSATNPMIRADEIVTVNNTLFYAETDLWPDFTSNHVFTDYSYSKTVSNIDNNLDTNSPILINTSGHPLASSPLIDAGDNFNAERFDILGFPNSTDVSIGAYNGKDSDNDSLADSWELYYFDDLSHSETMTESDDSLTNLEEYTLGSNPLMLDTDLDGISDTDENSLGYDPSYFIEIYQDYDGDGFINFYELHYETDPNDPLSFPSDSQQIFVNPNAINNGSGTKASPYKDIATAYQNMDKFSIISLEPGIYSGEDNRGISASNKSFYLRSIEGPEKTIIDLRNANEQSFSFSNNNETTTVSGITFMNSLHHNVLSSSSSDMQYINCIFKQNNRLLAIAGQSHVKIINCLFKNNYSYYNYGIIDITTSKVDIWGSTFLNNKFLDTDIPYFKRGSTFLTSKITNSIIYNEDATIYPIVYSDDYITSHHSYIQGGHPGENNIDTATHHDPMINDQGYLLPGSVCIDSGHPFKKSRFDLHLNERAGALDIGALQYRDVDGDNMDDAYEITHFSDLSRDGTQDFDDDGIIDYQEYLLGTSASLEDSDSDGLSDQLEISLGFNPTDPKERFLDYDGDGILNLYEIHYATDSTDRNSKPTATIFVDHALPSNTGNQYNNLQDAILASSNYDIIEVADGIYSGTKNIDLEIEHKLITIMAENSTQAIIEINKLDVNNTEGITFTHNGKGTVLNGIVIRYAKSTPLRFQYDETQIINCILELNESPVAFTNASPTFKNVLFRNNRVNADHLFSISSAPSFFKIDHCSFINNIIKGEDFLNNYNTIYELEITNSILWNNNFYLSENSSDLNVQDSIVEWGYSGINIIDAEPNINSMGFHLEGSNSIASGHFHHKTRYDIYRNPRQTQADLGPFSYIDTDGDFVADSYETFYFDNLNQDNDQETDGLNTSEEYLLGTDPTELDSDQDGLFDQEEIVFNKDPSSGINIYDDYDGDNFPDIFEMVHGTDIKDPQSFPAPTRIVDLSLPSNSGIYYNNIRDSLRFLDGFDVIMLKDGTYTGSSQNINNSPSEPMIMFSENGPEYTIIDGEHGSFPFINLNENEIGCYVIGLKIINFKEAISTDHFDRSRVSRCFFQNNEQVLNISSSTIQFENCIFYKNFNHLTDTSMVDRPAVLSGYMEPSFIHCSFLYNDYISDQWMTSTNTKFINSLIHETKSYESLFNKYTELSYTYIDGGYEGDQNIKAHSPKLSHLFYLQSDSPLIDQGKKVNNIDYFGIADTNALSDIGAIAFYDTDADNISDQFETYYYSNLNTSDSDDTDQDYANTFIEYNLGSSPSISNADTDPYSDFQEFVLGYNPKIFNEEEQHPLPFISSFNHPEYPSYYLSAHPNWYVEPKLNATLIYGNECHIEANTKAAFAVGSREQDNHIYYLKQNLILHTTPPTQAITQSPNQWFYVNTAGQLYYRSGSSWVDSSTTLSDLSAVKSIHIDVDYVNDQWTLYIDTIELLTDIAIPSEVYSTSFTTLHIATTDHAIMIKEFGILTALPFQLNFVDADSDGMNDSFESHYGLTDPTLDEDGDGLNNLDEYLNGTNPLLVDTDLDGKSDLFEIVNGHDPHQYDVQIEWPYYEPFESFFPTHLHGQDHWQSENFTAIDLVTETSWVTNALTVGDPAVDFAVEIVPQLSYADRGKFSKAFNTLYDKVVWVDFYITLKNQVEINIFDAIQFKVHEVEPIVYKKSNQTPGWVTTTYDVSDLIDDHEWDRFALKVDYDLGEVTCFLNGLQVFTESFSLTAKEQFNKIFSVMGTTHESIYFDEITISTATPKDFDDDADGLTNEQENLIGTNPKKADSDGDGLTDSFELNYQENSTQFLTYEHEIALLLQKLSNNPNNTPWEMTDEKSFEGDISLQSGKIEPNSTSVLEITADFGTSITFQRSWSTKQNSDYYRFYIDDVEQENRTGNFNGWNQITYDLTEGVHTLKWVFERGDIYYYNNIGGGFPAFHNLKDRVWIDFDFTIPEYHITLNLDPNNPDTDGDGMSDGWELIHTLNPMDDSDAIIDSDNDYLSNYEEFLHNTDPNESDSDGDGMRDDFEVQYELNLSFDDSAQDLDEDGLTNLQEFTAGSNPRAVDSDADGYDDLWEVTNGFLANSDDTTVDNDSDGLPDHYEAYYGISDPNGDADSDGWLNLQEYQNGTHPKAEDTDGDGVIDSIDDNPTDIDGWNDEDGPTITLEFIK